jgi:uncharacterized protein (DUF427 family)
MWPAGTQGIAYKSYSLLRLLLAPRDTHFELLFPSKKDRSMQAVLEGHVLADSDDIVESGGSHYFPNSATRLDLLEKAPKTAHDLECPHGVQFYDVVIDGERHLRAAWSYESPQPKMEQVRDRFGFWEEVRVG